LFPCFLPPPLLAFSPAPPRQSSVVNLSDFSE
jgi:hypothetical protein